ncbi:hypothetical protein D5086_002929 [Populus alba]|uniref:Uncharacterized protein n=1 Tax=Populus alba TaxID=43335 RepID=A0ACC4D3G4_POPAL
MSGKSKEILPGKSKGNASQENATKNLESKRIKTHEPKQRNMKKPSKVVAERSKGRMEEENQWFCFVLSLDDMEKNGTGSASHQKWLSTW